MKKIILSVMLLGMAGVVFGQYDPKALDILEGMSDKYQKIGTFSAKITSTLVNEDEGVNEEFSGTITINGDKYRLKMEEQEVINNGLTVWTYLSEVNEVNIDNYDPDDEEITPSKIYNAYKEGFKYLFVEDITEGGATYHVIDLLPEDRGSQFFRIRMNINSKDNSLSSWTMHERTGNVYKYSITEFDPNVNVKDSFFTFDASKYPGVEVIDLR
ncbi:MAG: outer membrane lipoprotein carrier protein LolA [Bacteroidota bacterium]